MKSLLIVILFFLPSFALAQDLTVYDKDWKVKARIEDGKIYDRNWKVKGYIKDNRIYDRDWKPKFYLKGGEAPEREGSINPMKGEK